MKLGCRRIEQGLRKWWREVDSRGGNGMLYARNMTIINIVNDRALWKILIFFFSFWGQT